MHIPKQLSDRQWDLYCVGNGRMAAYWNRGEMEGLFGPSYSAPDMLTLRHADAVRAAAPSVRRAQSAVWDTALEQSGEPAGSLTVFACREFPAVVVRVHALRPVRYRLGYSPGLNAGAEPPRENSGLLGQNGWLWQIRAGNYLYMDYPTPYPIWCQTLLRGAVHAQADGDGVLCTFAPGNSELWLIGGPDYAALAENAAQALALSAAQAERDCLTAWAQVYAAADLEARIPKVLRAGRNCCAPPTARSRSSSASRRRRARCWLDTVFISGMCGPVRRVPRPSAVGPDRAGKEPIRVPPP